MDIKGSIGVKQLGKSILDRVFKNWKTTLVGVVVFIVGVVLIYQGKADFFGLAGMFGTLYGINRMYAYDSSNRNRISEEGEDE